MFRALQRSIMPEIVDQDQLLSAPILLTPRRMFLLPLAWKEGSQVKRGRG